MNLKCEVLQKYFNSIKKYNIINMIELNCYVLSYLIDENKKVIFNTLSEFGDEVKWTIIIIKINNETITDIENDLKSKNKKYFIHKQNEKVFRSYLSNGMYQVLVENLPLSWIDFILQYEKDIQDISMGLDELNKSNIIILPYANDIFSFMHYIKPQDVKVIIIGQDPYPQKSDKGIPIANGIAFSTNCDTCPPSLENIFKELEYEKIDVDKTNYDLIRWVKQGCLLINSAWTVIEGEPKSHTQLWKNFVSYFVSYILEKRKISNKKVIVALFGSDAKKIQGIKKHDQVYKTLETSHPSPLSCDKGFFGSNIFTNINNLLIEIDEIPIEWI